MFGNDRTWPFLPQKCDKILPDGRVRGRSFPVYLESLIQLSPWRRQHSKDIKKIGVTPFVGSVELIAWLLPRHPVANENV
jgi:hypothetical protein